MKSNLITISVRGGVVDDVSNLPEDWGYRVIDWDDLTLDSGSRRCRMAEFAAEADRTGLERFVAYSVLDSYGTDTEIENFFHDVARHGCVSGRVKELICYADTHRFFDAHYEEIDALRLEAEGEQGEPLRIEGDLKNALARFAYEETASRIGRDLLGLEV